MPDREGYHQFSGVVDALEAAVKDAAGLSPDFLSPAQAGETLLALRRVEAGIDELVLRVMAAAPTQALAEGAGARDVAAWLVAQGRADARPAHSLLRLAADLERRDATRAALATGELSLEHARVIVRALDELTSGSATSQPVDSEIIARGEAHLIELAGTHTPAQLRRLATHLIEVVAPEVADASDARALARLEARARQRQYLSIIPAGDGLTRLHGVVPDAVGERLRTLVEAYAQPRVAALAADGAARPRPQLLAEAFGQLLEALHPGRLPMHGGDATTVMVTIDLDTLRRELGVARLGAEPITAAEARRLACTAQLIPAVLGGRSQPLDLGRAQRLFSPAQRKALRLRDRHCRADGCTVPAAWCDAHHVDPWSKGGASDLSNALLLCGHHHRRAHDPDYITERLPNGDYRYRRRT